MDLKGGDISATQGAFSFTDPGFLRTLQKDLAPSRDLHNNITKLVPGATFTETFPTKPVSFDVSFGGKQRVATLTAATLSVSLSVVAGVSVVDVQVTTGFSVKSPTGAPVEVTYSTGTSTRYDAGKRGEELTPLEILTFAGVVAFAAGTAFVIRGVTISPEGPPR